MNNLLYIVFNESGYYLSELLKEHNSNLKILHFCDKNKFKDTKADLRVELELNDNIWVGNEYLYYKYLSDDGFINKKDEKFLYNFSHAIIVTDILSETYPIALGITKRLLYSNVICYNINFEPFSFFGKRKLNHYKEFYNCINGINCNNYNYSCDDFLINLSPDYTLSDRFKKIYRKVFDIVINIEKELVSKNHQDSNKYTYVSVIYDDDIVAQTIDEPSFYYKTDLPINEGDKVLVDRNGKEIEGKVTEVKSFAENEVLFPINKTKDIIKILKKCSYSFSIIDPCYHILVIHDLDKKFEDKLTLFRAFVVKKDFPNINKLISKSDIIITVGDVNLSNFDISNQSIININNENNFGKHTSIVNLSDEKEFIQLINAIYYGLFHNGFIRFDLYDLQYGLGERIKYKNYSIDEIEKIYNDFNIKNLKKLFLIFEATPNTSLYDIKDFVDELRNKFGNIDIIFGVPIVGDNKETRVNIFGEI